MTDKNAKKGKIYKRRLLYVLIDVLIITGSFLIFVWIKPASLRVYLPTFFEPFLIFGGVWLAISILISKYSLEKAKNFKDIYIPVLISNITILAVITTMIYSFGAFGYSRLIVFGTIALTTVLELLIGYTYISVKKPVLIPEFDEDLAAKHKYYPTDKSFTAEKEEETKFVENREQIKDIIVNESSEEVYIFISKYLDVGNPSNLTLSTTTRFNIDQLPNGRFKSLVNLHQINGIQRMNKFFESVNQKLPEGGLFIDSAETYPLRKQRILEKFPVVINYIYYFFDYIFTRVFPKLPVLKKFYFWLTLGRNRVISRAETLGRLYSCGFECVDEQFIEGNFYFVVRKVKDPLYPDKPTYGPFIRLRRIGKNGKEIGVYKMRTMHAYSEYLQEYVYMKNSLQDGGKFSNDFRVTQAGKIMRKFWLDELPMIFNLFRGDMKIVGVRPLSRHYFSLYSDELKELRTRVKPGLVPPFYVDMPTTLEEIQASEKKYILAYLKNPFLTDIRYFFLAFFNIIFRRARSN